MSNFCRVSGSYKNIEIDSDMNCVDVIREALQKFGVEVKHICMSFCSIYFDKVEFVKNKGVNNL
jgi:hypothetical protein